MMMRYELEIDREEDGRWIAEITNFPGAIAYGQTRQDAVLTALAIADAAQKASKK